MTADATPHLDTTRRRFRVAGRVQGVAFRVFIRDRATALHLYGCVRNLPDGTVEIEAAGTPDAVATLRTAAEQGPPFARVTAVHEMQPTTDELPFPFRITR